MDATLRLASSRASTSVPVNPPPGTAAASCSNAGAAPVNDAQDGDFWVLDAFVHDLASDSR